MKIVFKFFYIIIFTFLCISISEAQDMISSGSISSMPVYYPENTIGSKNPYFIWYDANNERDTNDNVRYRITLKPEKGQEVKPVLFMPAIFEKNYYYFKWPFSLESDKYTYTIERLSDLKPTELKYFHYLKYPVAGEFEIDSDNWTVKDDLSPDKLIEYLRLEKENRLVNRNNFFFYSGASVGAFGIGLLFYKVLHFGIISKIIYYVAFTSSAVGVGATGYYGICYFYERSQMQKIVDVGKNVSVNGSLSLTAMCIDFEMRY